MSNKLANEIRQGRAFGSLEEEAILNLLKTGDAVAQHVTEFLKQYGLTITQYNVLRILRGAGDSGTACTELAERMITRDPDITRLVDRMESHDLVARERSSADRRVVVVKITKEALELLKKIDQPLLRAQKATLGKLGKSNLLNLIGSLERVRESLT